MNIKTAQTKQNGNIFIQAEVTKEEFNLMQSEIIYKSIEELIKEIAWMAWQDSANAHRLYPENQHTFSAYWENSKEKYNQFNKLRV